MFFVNHLRPWPPEPYRSTYSRPQVVAGIVAICITGVTRMYGKGWTLKLESPLYVTSDKDSYRNDSKLVWQFLPWPPWTQKWSTKLAKADRHPGWVFHAVNLGNMSAGFSQSARHFFATVYLARAPWYSNAAATIEISQWRTCGSSVGIKILIIWLHRLLWIWSVCVCVRVCL